MNTNKPLNILMITHHRRYRTTGRPQIIGRHLVERGHKVTLIATADENRFGIRETEWDGIKVVESPDLLWGKLRSGWDLWSMLNRYIYLNGQKEKYDLVHCFETRPGTIHPALYYAHKHHLPLFSDWNDWFGRGGIVDILRPKWYRLLFGGVETYYEEHFRPQCVGTTVISTALGKRAEGLGIPHDRICYLSGGVIPEEYVNRSIEECRVHVGLPVNVPVLGFASADSHLDLELVFSSLAIVAKNFPDVKLIITGKASPAVLQTAQEHGVRENLVLTGFVPEEELSWWLGSANIFLLPFPETIYNVGRWPNKVGIYMSLERPVITNPVGDVKTLIDKHHVGLMAEDDPGDFACKILTLLEKPELARELGANGRKAALTAYNWKSLICTLEDFYARILQEN
ncbi:MAG TPA: glycosyltransferase family 4 protein [Anaerolineales bacterium]|nr:glycosyltransferase family 4 protein [Anaerolineales bacterium]